MNTVAIPNSPYIALADDRSLTPWALDQGTIAIEKLIAACEPVASLKEGDLVIDCGAFIGDTAVIFQEQGAHVIAFEPQEDAFACLVHNVHTSPPCICFNQAVGDGVIVTPLQNARLGNLGTRTVARSVSGKPAIPLDWLASRYRIDCSMLKLIKIDVEGFEPAVLDGARGLIGLHKPSLLIEVYPEMLHYQNYTVASVYNRLLELGYDWDAIIGRESDPRWDVWAHPK